MDTCSAKFGKNFRARYRAAISGGLAHDPAQASMVRKLSHLGSELVSAQQSRSRLNRFRRWLGRSRSAPRGIYLWGGVGRGKTVLMDLFMDWLPLERKKRLHFHVFMQRVHRHLTALQGEPNPLRAVARRLANEAVVIGLDEFYVEDIGDAMVLANLLKNLLDSGTVLLATSNLPPHRLYENGLQRARFLPAIDLISEHLDVIELKGIKDFRLDRLGNAELYVVGPEPSGKELRVAFAQLAEQDPEGDYPLVINDRLLMARFHADGIGGFDFSTLCEMPRSAPDFMELAHLYHTVVIYGVRSLGSGDENVARRFIALIDEFYDRGVNVQFHASCRPDALYNGRRYLNEMKRTLSRISEMMSPEYLSREHRRSLGFG